MIKILWPKATWGFIWPTLPPHTPLSKDVRTGTEAEATEEWSFLVDPRGLPGLLSYLPRTTSPGVWYHSQWAGLFHVTLIKKILHQLVHRQACSGQFLSWASLFPHDSMLETIYWKMNWSLKHTKWPIIKQGPGELLDLIMPEKNREHI